ncbi:hypothetical protein [Mesorhizobium sp. B2-6-4]|uniref:hypothetical protein n=1 Tax=Mesorhizobium sp. B2-6-4 TaxID=2589913 RepID=UPI00116AE2B6|nr:hypothetical protein [Mesorhizobium sp. B2-6-4]TPJ49635.1 hypothetical protein FJ426_26385 [Mesorhizobium sp. B2-6-4]
MDIPYKTLPHNGHYRRRNAIAIWLSCPRIGVGRFGASRDVLWAIALVTLWIGAYYSGCATVQSEWDETSRIRLDRKEKKLERENTKRLDLGELVFKFIEAHPGTDYETARSKIAQAALEEHLQVIDDFWDRHDELRREARANLFG